VKKNQRASAGIALFSEVSLAQFRKTREEAVVAFQATRFRNCQTVLVFPFLVVVVVAADEISQHAFDTRRKGSWNARWEL
jgi:hypothetical protein